jgi:tetratricopeptide (TPR) repeat protein
VEATPDSPVGYDALGHASALAGDPDRGLAMLKKAIELDPEYGPAYAHLGRLYYTQLNYESAIENFLKSFDLGVRNEEYFYELGLAYAYLEDCPGFCARHGGYPALHGEVAREHPRCSRRPHKAADFEQPLTR